MVRWLISSLMVAFGGFLIHLSYRAYAKWYEYVSLGDHSGAEAYEVEFWPEMVLGIALLAFGCFLAGRASVENGKGSESD